MNETKMLTLTIEDVNDEINVRPFEGERVTIAGVPWHIMARWRPCEYSVAVLDFRVVCDGDAADASWKRRAKFQLRLLAARMEQYSDLKHYSGTFQTFSCVKNNWGCSKFITHKGLMNPNNGFVVNETIMLSAHVTVRKTPAARAEKQREWKAEVAKKQKIIEILAAAKLNDSRKYYYEDLDTVRQLVYQLQAVRIVSAELATTKEAAARHEEEAASLRVLLDEKDAKIAEISAKLAVASSDNAQAATWKAQAVESLRFEAEHAAAAKNAAALHDVEAVRLRALLDEQSAKVAEISAKLAEKDALIAQLGKN